MESALVKIAIATNSAMIIIFVIWFISAKISERKTKSDQKERERQLTTLLKHSHDQFDNAMKLIKESNDRFYGLQTQSVKYQSMITELLTKVELKIDFLRNDKN